MHFYYTIQLWALYEMTGREAFKRTTLKWQGYRKDPRFHATFLVSRGRTWINQRMT